MSIESEVKALTEAVGILATSNTSLAEAVAILAEVAPKEPGEPGETEDTTKTTKKKTAKKKASKKAASKKPDDDLDDLLGTETEAELDDATIQNVREAMLEYLEHGTQKDARAILKKLKASKLGELAEEKYGAAVVAFNTAKEALEALE